MGIDWGDSADAQALASRLLREEGNTSFIRGVKPIDDVAHLLGLSSQKLLGALFEGNQASNTSIDQPPISITEAYANIQTLRSTLYNIAATWLLQKASTALTHHLQRADKKDNKATFRASDAETVKVSWIDFCGFDGKWKSHYWNAPGQPNEVETDAVGPEVPRLEDFLSNVFSDRLGAAILRKRCLDLYTPLGQQSVNSNGSSTPSLSILGTPSWIDALNRIEEMNTSIGGISGLISATRGSKSGPRPLMTALTQLSSSLRTSPPPAPGTKGSVPPSMSDIAQYLVEKTGLPYEAVMPSLNSGVNRSGASHADILLHFPVLQSPPYSSPDDLYDIPLYDVNSSTSPGGASTTNNVPISLIHPPPYSGAYPPSNWLTMMGDLNTDKTLHPSPTGFTSGLPANRRVLVSIPKGKMSKAQSEQRLRWNKEALIVKHKPGGVVYDVYDWVPRNLMDPPKLVTTLLTTSSNCLLNTRATGAKLSRPVDSSNGSSIDALLGSANERTLTKEYTKKFDSTISRLLHPSSELTTIFCLSPTPLPHLDHENASFSSRMTYLRHQLKSFNLKELYEMSWKGLTLNMSASQFINRYDAILESVSVPPERPQSLNVENALRQFDVLIPGIDYHLFHPDDSSTESMVFLNRKAITLLDEKAFQARGECESDHDSSQPPTPKAEDDHELVEAESENVLDESVDEIANQLILERQIEEEQEVRRAQIKKEKELVEMKKRKMKLKELWDKAATVIQRRWRQYHAMIRLARDHGVGMLRVLAVQVIQKQVRSFLAQETLLKHAFVSSWSRAATLIQQRFRSWLVLTRFRRIAPLRQMILVHKRIHFNLYTAATHIQKNVRGWLVRRLLKKSSPFQISALRPVLVTSTVSAMNASATKIQAYWKSYVMREQLLHLRDTVAHGLVPFCKTLSARLFWKRMRRSARLLQGWWRNYLLLRDSFNWIGNPSCGTYLRAKERSLRACRNRESCRLTSLRMFMFLMESKHLKSFIKATWKFASHPYGDAIRDDLYRFYQSYRELNNIQSKVSLQNELSTVSIHPLVNSLSSALTSDGRDLLTLVHRARYLQSQLLCSNIAEKRTKLPVVASFLLDIFEAKVFQRTACEAYPQGLTYSVHRAIKRCQDRFGLNTESFLSKQNSDPNFAPSKPHKCEGSFISLTVGESHIVGIWESYCSYCSTRQHSKQIHEFIDSTIQKEEGDKDRDSYASHPSCFDEVNVRGDEERTIKLWNCNHKVLAEEVVAPGDADDIDTDQPLPVPVASLANSNSLWRLRDRVRFVVAWGNNAKAQCGAPLPLDPEGGMIGGFAGRMPSHWIDPLHISPLTFVDMTPDAIIGGGFEIAEVSSGRNFVLARSSCGRVFSWGDNEFGQCGLGSLNPDKLIIVPSPTILHDLRNVHVTKIFTASRHCAAVANGSSMFFMWGHIPGIGLDASNPNDEEDVEEALHYPTLVNIHPDSIIKHAVIRDTYNSILFTSGELFSWGRNDCGQLGNGRKPKLVREVQSISSETSALISANSPDYLIGDSSARSSVPQIVDCSFPVNIRDGERAVKGYLQNVKGAIDMDNPNITSFLNEAPPTSSRSTTLVPLPMELARTRLITGNDQTMVAVLAGPFQDRLLIWGKVLVLNPHLKPTQHRFHPPRTQSRHKGSTNSILEYRCIHSPILVTHRLFEDREIISVVISGDGEIKVLLGIGSRHLVRIEDFGEDIVNSNTCGSEVFGLDFFEVGLFNDDPFKPLASSLSSERLLSAQSQSNSDQPYPSLVLPSNSVFIPNLFQLSGSTRGGGMTSAIMASELLLTPSYSPPYHHEVELTMMKRPSFPTSTAIKEIVTGIPHKDNRLPTMESLSFWKGKSGIHRDLPFHLKHIPKSTEEIYAGNVERIALEARRSRFTPSEGV